MVVAGLGPWFYFALDDRTMFSFYAAPALPFLVLAVTYVLGAILGPARTPLPAPVGSSGSDGSDGSSGSDGSGPPVAEVTGPAAARAAQESDRRLVGAVIVGAYVLLVAICFGYFYPIFVGQLMDYADWSARMWLGSRWI
jgi:dolichyl-phosphate-mannose--protein O-mannosyl transferase